MADGAQPEDPVFEAKVLRAFVKHRRLVSLPARERKKQVVLRFLVDAVLPDDAEIQEPELNARLAAWHPDVAALRRYLVDGGYASRSGMAYRRAVPPRLGSPPGDSSRGDPLRDDPPRDGPPEV